MQVPANPPASTLSAEFYRNTSPDGLLQGRTILATYGYLRINKCLNNTLAECTHSELKEDTRYKRMEGEQGRDYGVLRCEGELSPCVKECCDFLKGPLFLEWLAGLLGSKVYVTRRPTPFKMKLGDCIVAHDDCSDYPSNRFSAVLQFSKAWKKEFGGNTVIGEVKRTEAVQSPRGGGRRWIFSAKRSVVVPLFNSLVLIALRPGMAHSVTRIRANNVRLTIVATYGLDNGISV